MLLRIFYCPLMLRSYHYHLFKIKVTSSHSPKAIFFYLITKQVFKAAKKLKPSNTSAGSDGVSMLTLLFNLLPQNSNMAA